MKIKTDLLPYQERAVEKLKKLKVGALYMEMGTGKTRVELELIKYRLDRDRIDCALWLCPCSVRDNLKEDLQKHADGWKRVIGIAGIESLSTSVALNSLLLELTTERRVMLIVDESNLVKNHHAKRTQNIIRLAENCKYKNILNGTPITKNEKDLFAQWLILDWRILGYKSFWAFANNHIVYSDLIEGKIDAFKNVDYLTSKISPYTYQIQKRECLNLPSKSYEKKYCYMTTKQQQEYSKVAEFLFKQIEEDEFNSTLIYRLFTGLQLVLSGNKIETGDHLIARPMFKNPKDNPRIQALIDIIRQTTEEKIIIFCKYTQEIEDIQKVLEEEYGTNEVTIFCGKLSQKERSFNRERFFNKCRFFVANKSCAGYGLNLQFCNFVIYYSNDFDLATRIQSEDRVHRIGQKNNVLYTDICMKNSLDERILNCLEKKENILQSFKKQIDAKKDSKEVFVKKYIYYKNVKRKERIKRIENEDIKVIEGLKEEL